MPADGHLRHPRPGRGLHPGRPGGGDERRAGSSRSAHRRKFTATRQSLFVARFLGLDQSAARRVLRSRRMAGRPCDTTIGALPAPGPARHSAGPVTVLLRPDGVSLDGKGPCQPDRQMLAKTSFRGSTCRAVVDVQAESPLAFDFPSSLTVASGRRDSLELSFDPADSDPGISGPCTIFISII